MEEVDNDFKRLRSYGFNLIVLTAGWGQFQTRMLPASYNAAAFRKMAEIMEIAEKNGLWVMVRLGTPDHLPEDMRDASSYNIPDAMFDEKQMDALAKLYREVSVRLQRYPNFFGIFYTWEDFSTYLGLLGAPYDARLTFERRMQKFQVYLHDRHSLETLNKLWGTSYGRWKDIPVPASGSKGLRDYLDFIAIRINEGPLKKLAAAGVSQSLGYEVRVDQETVEIDGRPAGYSYIDALKLPERFGFLAAYYNPAWRAPKQKFVTPEFVDVACKRLISISTSAVGTTPIFFDQLNLADDTPAFIHNPRLKYPDDEARAVQMVLPLIFRRTLGYSLWAFEDYVGNIVEGGTFQSDSGHWLSTKPLTFKRLNPHTYLKLDPGQSIRQYVSAAFNPGNATSVPYRFEIEAEGCQTGAPVVLTIQIEGTNGTVVTRKLSIARGEKTCGSFVLKELRAEQPRLVLIRLGAKNSGSVLLQRVSLWNHLMAIGLLDRFGVERPSRANAYRQQNLEWSKTEKNSLLPFREASELSGAAVNNSLTSGNTLQIPIYVPLSEGETVVRFKLQSSATRPTTISAQWLCSSRNQSWKFLAKPGENLVRIPNKFALRGDNILVLKNMSVKTFSQFDTNDSDLLLTSASSGFVDGKLAEPVSGQISFPFDPNTNRVKIIGKLLGEGCAEIKLNVGGHTLVKNLRLNSSQKIWSTDLLVDKAISGFPARLFISAGTTSGTAKVVIEHVFGESDNGPNDIYPR